ncbi:hypothetical protein [Brevundimonas sp.]|uniref:hypothetical protein n=1 Tax=Brevundimonas sp. TaxID=1871086 RepID=UPI002D43B770|nr:hypothetical protein [Brevundimonas sp.]HYC69304.1 hypothetical protein [Brevundimonas sp.]
MLITTVALAAAVNAAAASMDLGSWRIVTERAEESVAVRLEDEVGGRRTAYVLTTYARPRTRRTGGSYRQLWTELSIRCPRNGNPGFYGEVWSLIAEESVPLPQDDLAPPMALRSFDDDRMGALALGICNGQAGGTEIEGDWATVLATLLARSDHPEQR